MEKRYQRLLSGVLPFLLALGIMVVWVQYAETATISKTNNTSGQADGSFITRTVTFDTADFSAGAQIESTTIAVRFEKIDGNSCAAGHQGGSAFNGEIYMYLESPAGTQVPLVNDINDHAVPAGPTTYNNTAYAGEVTVTFDDLAGTKASGLPTTGTFRPEGTLASFNGEDPAMGDGEWVLYVGDAVTNDALCFKSFTLTVNASQAPTVDDQTFSVDESAAIGSAVGTVVATDNDPGEKLNFEIIASDPTADFDINQLTGELTVANALDFETTPVYTLTVRVTDSTGLFDEATITINVNFVNIAPQLANVVNTSPIVENGVVTVTGDIVDLNGGDTFTLTVDWGDGNMDTYNYSAGTTDFSETHQYLDDDADDMYTVGLTLDDSGGSQATAETTVTVSNEAPVVSNVNVSAGSIDEGDSVTLTGDIADVGTLDTFTLQVQWGDGTTDNYNYAAGTTNFSESHTYADDNPTGTAFDTNTIVVTLTDDDSGSDSDNSQSLTVNNLDPALSGLSLTAGPLAEGTAATLSGTIIDTGANDTFVLTVDWGDTVETYNYAATGPFTATHTYTDDSGAGSFDVSASLADDDTGTDDAGVVNSITVTNVAPAPSGLSATTTTEGSATTFTAAIGDPGSGDTYTVTIGWGDGITETFNYIAGSTNINETHVYTDDNPTATPSDSYTISLIVEDDDGDASGTLTTSVTVNNAAPVVNAGADLLVSKSNPVATFAGSFTDVGLDDTHTILWEFGDGTSVMGTLVPTHTYPAVTASYVVTLTVTDDDTGVSSDTLLVEIGNIAPTAVDDTGTTDEDTVLSVNAPGVLGNDSDPDGDPFTITAFDTASVNGAVVNVAADGSYTYDPTGVAALQALAVGANLVDSFTYTVSDPDGLTSVATVEITVNGVNDDPQAVDDTVSTPKDTPATVIVLLNDTDIDGDSLTVATVGTPTNGIATTNGSTVVYTPDTGFTGMDVFTYTVSDGNGGTSTANITVNIAGDQVIYLPVIANRVVSAPDLVVASISGRSDLIEVTIENQGTQGTVDAFWVDFYIDPTAPPTAPNEFWQDLSEEGLVWLVDVPLMPGESLTLSYSTADGAPNLHFSEEFSLYMGDLPAGTPLYAQVDSAHIDTTYGGILETHEYLGTAYNNVSEQVLATN